jgi:cytochrome c553
MISRATRKRSIVGLITVALAATVASVHPVETDSGTAVIEQGRYLAQLAGCNDCHTPGYLYERRKDPRIPVAHR